MRTYHEDAPCRNSSKPFRSRPKNRDPCSLVSTLRFGRSGGRTQETTMDAMKILGKAMRLLAAATLLVGSADLVAAQTKAPAKSPQVLFVQTAKNVAFKDGVL